MTREPEGECHWQRGISYHFGDLREIPFRAASFDIVVSISTIEHIGMDNSIYGWGADALPGSGRSHEYEKAVAEMVRVLSPGGRLLITVPYGRYEHHGFFQQFDRSMLARVTDILPTNGRCEREFFRYVDGGWTVSTQRECDDLSAFNPHTGRGKGNDGAAHCRSVCCLRFEKGYEPAAALSTR